jgi:hypothetical protein
VVDEHVEGARSMGSEVKVLLKRARIVS